MSLQPTPTDQDSLAAQHAEDAQYFRTALHKFIDISGEIAELIRQTAAIQAAAPADIAAVADIATTFDGTARTVRRCIILARHVAKPMPAAAFDPARPRVAARRRIIRVVEDNIHRHAADAESEALHAELLERLDRPELDDDLAERPVDDIIADMCRDLGLVVLPGADPWKRRTPADLATLSARAAAPPAVIRTVPAPRQTAAVPPGATPPRAAEPAHATPRIRGP